MTDLPPPPPPPQPPQKRRLPGGPWPWSIAAVLVIAGIATGAVLLLGGDDAEAQTVRFQQPVDVGPDPFIDKPADRKGKRKVKITPSSPAQPSTGTFGGSGSDLVCDRDLLIRSLKAYPDRLAEWARVLGVEPTIKAVGAYIAKLHPVTLTRDTRVTNHSFVNGRAVPFQSILAAGTAVLVDDYGNPVARCRCGNPLLKPLYIPEAVCLACPPRYQPPPACEYSETTTIRRRFYPSRYYSNASYDEIFIRRFRSSCYAAYPDPPRVTITTIYNPKLRPRSRPEPAQTVPPGDVTIVPTQAPQGTGRGAASFSPTSGTLCRSYTLTVSGFAPNAALTVSYLGQTVQLQADGSGGSIYTFDAPPGCEQSQPGTYTATVTDPATGDSASASLTKSLDEGSGGSAPSGGDDELHCDPPRSQLESEQCAGVG